MEKGENMKRTIAIILCAVMLMSLCGCGKQSFSEYLAEREEKAMFVVVSDDYNGTILMHKETGVCYMWRKMGNGAGLTVMLNPDGTPYVWEAHND